ncbi:MAG: GNAT family N-acetyltransferase [Demequina sp.]|uniref:GNAT family N-acetyltransferase n=1 Tax=Demequina sp. TaxID=2050685 RepID=UPI003A8811AF
MTTTPRLTLRPFRPDDAEAIFAYLAHPESVRFEPYGMPSREDCDAIASERADDDRFIAICAEDGTLVGNIYLAPEGPPAWATWQIGYVLGPQHWGHGYASEAVREVLHEAFSSRHAHRVIARCNPINVRSWRLLERVGMRREAHMLQAASFASHPDGTPIWHDSYHYAILDSDRRP